MAVGLRLLTGFQSGENVLSPAGCMCLRPASQVPLAAAGSWDGGRGQPGPGPRSRPWPLGAVGGRRCRGGPSWAHTSVLSSCFIPTPTPPRATCFLLPASCFYSHIESLKIADSIFHFAFHLRLSFSLKTFYGDAALDGIKDSLEWKEEIFISDLTVCSTVYLIHLWSPPGEQRTERMDNSSNSAGRNTRTKPFSSWSLAKSVRRVNFHIDGAVYPVRTSSQTTL